MILYCPEPSVMAVRVLSINAGLDASTVTPGSTAPDVSLTRPAIVVSANAVTGTINTHARVATAHRARVRIILLLNNRRFSLRCAGRGGIVPITVRLNNGKGTERAARGQNDARKPLGAWTARAFVLKSAPTRALGGRPPPPSWGPPGA